MVETPGGSAPQPPQQQPGAWPEPPAQPVAPPPAAPQPVAPPPVAPAQEPAAGQAGYAAPPPAAAEAPKKKSKKWLWIGCGCLVLILLGCIAAVALGGLGIFTAVNKAGPVVQMQADLALMKAGQIQQVHANASDDFRTNVSVDRLQEFVNDNPILKDWTGQANPGVSIENEKGSAKITLKDASGKSQRFDFVYVKVGEAWKLLSIEKIDEDDGDDS